MGDASPTGVDVSRCHISCPSHRLTYHLVFALSNTDALPAYRLLTKRSPSHGAAELNGGTSRFALVKQGRDSQGYGFAFAKRNRFARAPVTLQ